MIKLNTSARYATESTTAAVFVRACEQAGVPTQWFVTRSDLACGSTIGPLTAAQLGMATVDVGVAQLAMHSCREWPAAMTRVGSSPHSASSSRTRFSAVKTCDFVASLAGYY